ncbi:MAG: hypothetical protein WCT08_03995 [Patescibacteria group bacterium]|jgi:hypothetical protein
MEIHIDFNPSPKDHFFISVKLNNKVAISFDKTLKGHRIIKQIFRKYKAFPKNTKFNSEWNTIILKNGKFLHEYHVLWVNLDKSDWLNGEIWETVWEKSISQKLSDNILHYSQLISDNYKDLHKISDKIDMFEKLLSKEIANISDL